jgi:hypothetical protein
MEEEKHNTSSPQQVYDTQQVFDLHAHSISGVQKNVEFIMEHLNDPNFNLTCPPSFIPGVEEESTRRYISEDGNGTINPEE